MKVNFLRVLLTLLILNIVPSLGEGAPGQVNCKLFTQDGTRKLGTLTLNRDEEGVFQNIDVRLTEPLISDSITKGSYQMRTFLRGPKKEMFAGGAVFFHSGETVGAGSNKVKTIALNWYDNGIQDPSLEGTLYLELNTGQFIYSTGKALSCLLSDG